MRPAYDDDTDHDDRLTRLEGHDREVASQLAALDAASAVRFDSLDEKMATGFARIDQQLAAGMSQIGQSVDQLQTIVKTLTAQQQSDREARHRWRTAGKWAAGVAGAVAGAIVLHGLGLR